MSVQEALRPAACLIPRNNTNLTQSRRMPDFSHCVGDDFFAKAAEESPLKRVVAHDVPRSPKHPQRAEVNLGFYNVDDGTRSPLVEQSPSRVEQTGPPAIEIRSDRSGHADTRAQSIAMGTPQLFRLAPFL